MNTFEPVVIISAENAAADRYTNQERTSQLRSRLLQLGLPFDGISGVFKGKEEIQFLVVTKDLELMKKLAKEFSQNAILSCDANRTATLHFSNGIEKNVGKLKQVTKEDTKTLDAFTIVRDNGKEFYFATI